MYTRYTDNKYLLHHHYLVYAISLITLSLSPPLFQLAEHLSPVTTIQLRANFFLEVPTLGAFTLAQLTEEKLRQIKRQN
jgi:hypothetical protein